MTSEGQTLSENRNTKPEQNFKLLTASDKTKARQQEFNVRYSGG